MSSLSDKIFSNYLTYLSWLKYVLNIWGELSRYMLVYIFLYAVHHSLRLRMFIGSVYL